MARKSIELFMWGYQTHFRALIELKMRNVLEELGVDSASADCLLVGLRIPSKQNLHDVCAEPEGGKWPIQFFYGLHQSFEEQISTHPRRDIIYSDEPSMRDKPENIRRDSARLAVEAAFSAYDDENQVQSFAGHSAPVGDYYVVPVIQIPKSLFERFRPLRGPLSDGYFVGSPSLIHAAVVEVLREVHTELLQPDPGGNLGGRSRSAEEITRLAAVRFMYSPLLAIWDRRFSVSNLFERLNQISSLMYEGTEGMGRMLLANPDEECVSMMLELAEPVPFQRSRWSRKVLEMASAETALIADGEKILGLGTVAEDIDPWVKQRVFEIEFLDHFHWRLSCGQEVLLVSHYGVPSLPQEPFSPELLRDTFQRLFATSGERSFEDFLTVFQTAVSQSHGSMIVVAEDAENEAERLGGQGTKIEPVKLTPKLFERVSGIDGTIIVDPRCMCHAIGVILDGPARPECTPSRGSRYNSAIRYVGANESARLAVVVSDDRTVDVLPVLRPRIWRKALTAAIERLEAATLDDYHEPRSWLEQHRFYLNGDQCTRVNAALDRIESLPKESGELVIITRRFQPDEGMDDSYFFDSADSG